MPGSGRRFTPRTETYDVVGLPFILPLPVALAVAGLGIQVLRDERRFRYGLLIVVLTLVPAWLGYIYIETPSRCWRYVAKGPWRAIKVGWQ